MNTTQHLTAVTLYIRPLGHHGRLVPRLLFDSKFGSHFQKIQEAFQLRDLVRSFVGCQPVDRHRKRVNASRSVWSRQGLPADLQTSIPTDGGSRRSKHSGHNLWQKESGPSLLLVLAQVQDLENGQRHR